MATSHCIAFEPGAGFLEELWYQRKIALGTGDIDVSEKSGKPGQEALNVGATSIPTDEPVNGSGMTKIVQSWLLTGLIVTEYIGGDP
jgi:hypothetical protein